MIKVLIADDQELIRQSLSYVLDAQKDIEIVGTAVDGKQAIELVRKQHPDVVLMDIRMPEVDGVECTKLIKSAYPNMKIIILTTFDDDEYVMNGLKYGASGYLLKGISVPELSAAIRKVAEGGAMLNTDIVTKVVKLFSQITATNRIIEGWGGEPVSTAEQEERQRGFSIQVDMCGVKELTRTERNTVRLVGPGMSNREIAEKLNFSEGTVRNSLSIALGKLALRDRTQMAIWAVQTGMAQQPLE